MNNEQNSAIEELKRAAEEAEAFKRSNIFDYLDLMIQRLESDFIRPEDIKAIDNIRKQYKKLLTRSRIQKLIKANGNILDPESLDPEDRETSEALKAYHRRLINAKYTIGFSRYRNKPDQDIINELKTDIHFLIAKFYKENENADDLAADEWEDYLKACMFEPLSFCENIHAEELINLINSELEIKENWKPKKKTKQESILEMPNYSLVFTGDGYRHALSTFSTPEDKAFIVQIKENVFFPRDSRGNFIDPETNRLLTNIEKYKDNGKPVIVTPLLHNIFTIFKISFDELLKEEKKKINYSASIKFPAKEFVKNSIRGMNSSSGVSKSEIYKAIDEIKLFSHAIGIVQNGSNNKNNPDIFPLLNFGGYIASENTIEISAPYFMYLLKKSEDDSYITHKKRNGQISKIQKPQFSYDVLPTIAKARNDAAVQVVYRIVQLIATRGCDGDTWSKKAAHNKRTAPKIKLKTLIEECPNFNYEFETAPENRKSQVIQRVLSYAWEYLRKYTRLQERYKDIQLPDPNKKEDLPLKNDLNHVFYFRHHGLIEDESEKKD